MLLDAVLAVPEVEWLTTTAEKTGYLERLQPTASVGAAPLPSVDEASATTPPLASAFPIGVARDGRAVLFYLASEPATVQTDTRRTALSTRSPTLAPEG